MLLSVHTRSHLLCNSQFGDGNFTLQSSITVSVTLRTPGKLIPLHVVLTVKQKNPLTVADSDLLPKASPLAQLPLLVSVLDGEKHAAETEGKGKISGLERRDSFCIVSRKICVA